MKEKRNQFRQMTTAQKIRYIWDYYKLVLIAVAAGIACAVYLIVRAVSPDPEVLLGVLLVNAGSSGMEETPEDAFYRYLTDNSYDTENETIEVESIENSVSTYQVLFARLVAGETDLLVGDMDTVEMLQANDGFLDLSDVISEELIEQCGDGVYTVVDEDTGEEGIYALRLPEDNQLVADGYYAEEELWIAIPYTSERVEMARDVLEYLMEFEQ